MLKNFNLDSAAVLADKMSASNLSLDVMRDTPLAQVIDACYHPQIENEVNEAEGSFIDTLLSSSSASDDGRITHDDAVKSVVDIVAETVSNNLQLAKGVVNPIIQQVVESVDTELAEQQSEAVNYLSVVPLIPHAIWKSPILENLVDKYMDTANEALDLKNIFPEKTPEEVIEAMKTGTSRFDDEVKAYVEYLGDEKIVEVYKNAFQKFDILDGNVHAVYNLTAMAKDKDMDSVMVIHLIARRFYKEVPEGVNLSLTDHRDYMSRVIAQSGRIICRFLDDRERAYRRKDLGVQYPSGSFNSDNPSWNIIYVNGDIYNDWLKEGGCPEILFGSAITHRERGGAALLEQGEFYKNAWERQCRIRESELKNLQYSKTILALRRGLSKQINQLSDDQLVVEDRGVLHARLVEQLKQVTPTSFKDMYSCVRKLVCRTMFPHTEAEEILCKIDDIGKRYPEMEVREAALLATIDLVTDWVAQFIVVGDAK